MSRLAPDRNCQIALGAVRSDLRRVGIDPFTVDAEGALKRLDDIARSEPDLTASVWYHAVSGDHSHPRHLKSFKHGWKMWRKEEEERRQEEAK